jgi:hypothetical protein
MSMIFRVLKWAGLGLFALIVLFVVSNCTMLGLNSASLKVDGKPPAMPAIAATDLAAWQAERARLKLAFAREVYGAWPEGLPVRVESTRVADADYLRGVGTLEEWVVVFGTGEGERRVMLAVAWPNGAGAQAPVPLLLAQSFSDNCLFFQSLDLKAPDGTACTRTQLGGFGGWLLTSIFGEYITGLPIDDFLVQGYAVASFQGSDLVPDADGAAQAAIAGLMAGAPPAADGLPPPATLAMWAYGFSGVLDVLVADARTDAGRLAVFGHSRHAKAALLAAAHDERIALTLSHQSGYGGAALSRSTTGEGIARMTGAKRTRFSGYPYWFTPAFAIWARDLEALPLDQHQLVALIAPRAVFLGNGRKDVWSDPNASFRAAQAAGAVWRLFGGRGLDAAGMLDFRAGDDVSYFLRGGGHGITRADVDAMLAAMAQHLGAR